MIFTPTEVRGTWLIDIEPIADERGFSARSVCRQEFARSGLSFSLAQANVAFTRSRGTLRGRRLRRWPPLPAGRRPRAVVAHDLGGWGTRTPARIAELYTIAWSLTGPGVRETLALLQPRVPVEMREVRSATAVLDWQI